MSDDKAKKVEQLLGTPNLADALESDRFKQFLDHIPFAVAVSELRPSERIISEHRVRAPDRQDRRRNLWQALEFPAEERDRQG
jgi:hypothetical protein